MFFSSFVFEDFVEADSHDLLWVGLWLRVCLQRFSRMSSSTSHLCVCAGVIFLSVGSVLMMRYETVGLFSHHTGRGFGWIFTYLMCGGTELSHLAIWYFYSRRLLAWWLTQSVRILSFLCNGSLRSLKCPQILSNLRRPHSYFTAVL